MKVLIVYDAATLHTAGVRGSVSELAEADVVIGLNEEGSEGTILKDRWGKPGTPVKVVS